MNEGCHAEEVWDEDTTFRAIEEAGSRIVIPLEFYFINKVFSTLDLKKEIVLKSIHIHAK